MENKLIFAILLLVVVLFNTRCTKPKDEKLPIYGSREIAVVEVNGQKSRYCLPYHRPFLIH